METDGTTKEVLLRGATAMETSALILEHSFHTNASATAWLLNDNNLAALAKAEAEAIATYYGIADTGNHASEKKSGWHEENSGWRYYNCDTGDCVANIWVKDPDDGKWYWFDGAGMMVCNVWYMHNNHWYYLGPDGAMLKGLQDISGKWYYLDQDGRMATKAIVLTPNQDGALQYPGLAK